VTPGRALELALPRERISTLPRAKAAAIGEIAERAAAFS
jgi:hypothetical protein